jgi:hypothetical protein
MTFALHPLDLLVSKSGNWVSIVESWGKSLDWKAIVRIQGTAESIREKCLPKAWTTQMPARQAKCRMQGSWRKEQCLSTGCYSHSLQARTYVMKGDVGL